MERISLSEVRAALERRGPPPSVPELVPPPELPGRSWRPAAVMCLLFEDGGQAEVVLTRRSAHLRSHTGQVSFPGGRIDAGEAPVDAALREAKEEVGIDPSSIEVIGQLGAMHTIVNPAPILPFVGALAARPAMVLNPAEVERAFTVPLAELTQPGVYHAEVWTFPDGTERSMYFFDVEGDTVWGATARMLYELLIVVLAPAS